MENKRVLELVKAYQKEKAAMDERAVGIETDAARLQRELTDARLDLDVAIDKALDKPTEANLQAEREARRRVADLELDIMGVDQRRSRSFTVGSGKASQLARETKEAGREEAAKYYTTNIGDVLKAIEDAKRAYLLALKKYYDLRVESGEIYLYAVSETDGRDDPGNRPNFSPELIPFYRKGGPQVHGVFADEIEQAFKHGVIHQQSIGDGDGR